MNYMLILPGIAFLIIVRFKITLFRYSEVEVFIQNVKETSMAFILW
jgi:hypothetical protein